MRNRIGIDFDNTIVCYDAIFHRVGCERGLIPPDLPINKTSVRDYLRNIGQEDAWTGIQGHVYGARMAEAEAFPGVLDFLRAAQRAGREVSVISHKTRHPFKDELHDLHQSALRWLEQNRFFDAGGAGLRRENLHLELTKEAKLNRIARCGCDWFIDDLPEFLTHPAFPMNVSRILFDPNQLYQSEAGLVRVQHWTEAQSLLL